MPFARLARDALVPALVVVWVCGPVFAADPDFRGAYDLMAHGFKERGLESMTTVAESGDTRAQYYLGIALMKGNVGVRDMVRGYAWLQIAADCGPVCTDADATAAAREARIKLGRFLTGPQLIEAERVAESYLQPKLREAEQVRANAMSALRSGQDVAGVRQYPGCALTPAASNCKSVALHGIAPICAGVLGDVEDGASLKGPSARITSPNYPMGVGDVGTITFLVHVDDTGYVCRAVMLQASGNEAIDMSAIDAVLRWRLEPATISGVPVESFHEFHVTFANYEFQIE